jgi:predicted nucleotidyltransferase
LGSVAIKSIDHARIEKDVLSHSAELKRKFAEVERVIWFGSWVNGLPTPGSDVDICLIISRSELKGRDRLPRYLPDGFPMGLDLLIYTADEFDRLKDSSPRMYAAIAGGKEI